MTTTRPLDPAPPVADELLLKHVAGAVHEAGDRLLSAYSPGARPSSRGEIVAAVRRNEQTSLDGLRTALSAARPGAGWVQDELETVPLPGGEWWVVDAVEGNVNHVHGLPEWCVTATLVRDGAPVLAVVRQPVGDLTWTAVRGGGAHRDGQRLSVSAKTDLDAAIATTGQAEAGQEHTYRRIGDSVAAMLAGALLVRATVPSTFPMLGVAAGQADLFWQYETVLPGVAAGVLLVGEAGGVVTDTSGAPWHPGSRDVLVAAPGVHAAAVQVLAAVA